MLDLKTFFKPILCCLIPLSIIGCTTSGYSESEPTSVVQGEKRMEALQKEFETFAEQNQVPPYIIYRYEDRVDVVVETNSDRSKMMTTARTFLASRPAIQVRVEKFPQFRG